MIPQALQEPSNSANDEEAGGGDTDGVRGVDQQQRGGLEVQDLGEQAKSSSSENVAAQPLATEEMSRYKKIRTAKVKQREELPKQLKIDWRGFKESEGIVTGRGLKGAKKMKVVEKGTFNTRTRAKKSTGVEKEAAHPRSVEDVGICDQLRGQGSKQDLGTLGKGLDNEYNSKQTCKVALLELQNKP